MQAKTYLRLMLISNPFLEIEHEFTKAVKLKVYAALEDVKNFMSGLMDRLPRCIQEDSALQDLIYSIQSLELSRLVWLCFY